MRKFLLRVKTNLFILVVISAKNQSKLSEVFFFGVIKISDLKAYNSVFISFSDVKVSIPILKIQIQILYF